jgi:pantetheine-phosphate adenylyltransferase
MHTAIYPGTFDPLTYGHIDIIERASKVFDTIIVTVATNSRKTPSFSVEERLEMIQSATRNYTNVRCDRFHGLIADYAKSVGANVLIRGLRAVSDFEFEFQMALVNRKLSHELVTVFLMPGEKYTYLNSTIVKEIGALGGDISSFVPDAIAKKVYHRLQIKK